jgi:uncharacterized damage-inducible protein DinB
MSFRSPLAHSELPFVAPEREALKSWLDFYRAELLARLEGLDEEQAGRQVLGSLTTLHGLIRHLTKVEHIWFVQVLAGQDEPAPFGWPDVTDGDFRLDDSAGLDADVAAYLAACSRSREIAAVFGLDETRPRLRGGGDVDVRWVLLHMIEEYAQHLGHADIVRELIDGTTQS